MSKKEPKIAILVGDGEELLSFYAKSHHQEKVLGIFCSETIRLPEGLLRLGDIADTPSFLEGNPLVRRLYCGISCIQTEYAQRIRTACKVRAVKFCAVLPVINSLEGKFVQMHIKEDMMLTPSSEPLSHLHNRVVKRLFDLALVFIFMLVFFPFVYIVKAIVLKRRKHGPSFSTQCCCGPKGKVFHRVSFREETNSLAGVFNVLLGQMSLVGPESFPVNDTNDVPSLPKHLERNYLRPGMTGWAQLKHFAGEERLSADIWYAEHWSLWLDIKILFLSVIYRA